MSAGQHVITQCVECHSWEPVLNPTGAWVCEDCSQRGVLLTHFLQPRRTA